MGRKKGKDGRWETEEERKKADGLRGKRGKSLRARIHGKVGGEIRGERQRGRIHKGRTTKRRGRRTD
jgi:hypothetical protein